MRVSLLCLTIFACLILVICLLSDPTTTLKQTINEEAKQVIITYRQLGNNGRLGNQMFQIAATFAFAKKNNLQLQLPPWKYAPMFSNSHKYYQENTIFHNAPIARDETAAFSFTDHTSWEPVSDIQGYRQNVKYFDFVESDIRNMFAFSPALLESVQVKPGSIGLHVRRGDYVSHPIHNVCTKDFYLNAVQFLRHLHPEAPVIIITDDKKWCQTELLPKIPNSSISPYQSEQEDMVCLSLCSYKIISNSTFAWWSAWLDNREDSEVVAPTPWIKQQPNEDWKLLYLPKWHIYDVETNSFL